MENTKWRIKKYIYKAYVKMCDINILYIVYIRYDKAKIGRKAENSSHSYSSNEITNVIIILNSLWVQGQI